MRFTWQGDRFAHEISLLRDGSWQVVLASAEGTPLEDWPASPPFQSLHIEEREDGRTLALLVGMAGKSHWSASVEIDAGSKSVLFDVACRVRAPAAGRLASSYQRASESATAGCPLALELTGRFGPTHFKQDGTQSSVVADVESGECPQTVRWDYRVAVA